MKDYNLREPIYQVITNLLADENIRGSGQPQAWKYNFISEDKYTIKKDTRPYGFRWDLLIIPYSYFYIVSYIFALEESK